MKVNSIKVGAFIAALTSIPLMALMYLGQQIAQLPFLPFDVFDWLARNLPGDVITLGIDAIVSIIETLNLGATSESAKLIEQLSALILFVVTMTLAGVVVTILMRRRLLDGRKSGNLLSVLLVATFILIEIDLDNGSILLDFAWIAALIAVWGFVIGSLLQGYFQLVDEDTSQPLQRLSLQRLVAGSLGLALGTWGISRLFDSPAEDVGASVPLELPTSEPSATPTLAPEATGDALPQATATATMRDRVPPAPGTRPELTSNEDFYRIDINTRSPIINGEEWTLAIAGLFDNTGEYSLQDLMALPMVTQPITLSCISNRVGGDLIGTSNWTGLRLREFVEQLGLKDDVQALYVEAEDGFYETVSLQDMMDPRTLLVYGMNGETLPVEHGFPLRIYIPNRYGMKQPKWITKITAIKEDRDGYWVVRGWSKEARPQIVSVIDAVAVSDRTQDGRIPIGGIAWAGDRGITRVEVSIDDGDWQEATLRNPPLSPLTWLQWRFDWMANEGNHTVMVRAMDGTGALQIEQQSGVRPDGATGYHSRDFRV